MDLSIPEQLQAIFNAPSPPTIKELNTLPGPTGTEWAVYLLILEKDNQKPRVHIGSATNKRDGIRERFNIYDSRTTLPYLVQEPFWRGTRLLTKLFYAQRHYQHPLIEQDFGWPRFYMRACLRTYFGQ